MNWVGMAGPGEELLAYRPPTAVDLRTRQLSQAVQEARKHSEVPDARATPGYRAKPRRHWAGRLLGASSPAADPNSAAALERRSTESYGVATSRVDVDRGCTEPALRMLGLRAAPDPTEMMGRAGVDISF
jgi:hypothetical protein